LRGHRGRTGRFLTPPTSPPSTPPTPTPGTATPTSLRLPKRLMAGGYVIHQTMGYWQTTGISTGSGGGFLDAFWNIWSAYWNHIPISGSFGVPIVPQVGLIASVPFAYTPGTQTACVGIGPGFATPGKSVNVGPLLLGNLPNSQSVLSGQRLSFNVQATPLSGVQYMTNSSGSLGGPTVGTPGGSIAYTWSACGSVR
jgi:hypothetical protein